MSEALSALLFSLQPSNCLVLETDRSYSYSLAMVSSHLAAVISECFRDGTYATAQAIIMI
jgi:hypothetical protein